MGPSDEEMRLLRAEVGRRAGEPGPLQDVYRRSAALYDGNPLLDPDASNLSQRFYFSKPHDASKFPPRTSSRWLSLRQRLALFIAPWLREELRGIE